ncbi:MAG: hypothetical protein D6691_10535 [Candidatus Hydrogenedentota bacterium]|uniref:Uncharacterized protein n=1 Tax=Sumerlaea chitinivorans TaxID=2250252 RepID=A0A2Z4Y8R4_SUMC1|nr:hypothetical protein BRCON_2879 [Candidatus Sumerlaea chitinivorans]RMH25038.1 MAG: hypothetical protein D6691_10535 [Candidatus Hydrogenedentota bacterium]
MFGSRTSEKAIVAKNHRDKAAELTLPIMASKPIQQKIRTKKRLIRQKFRNGLLVFIVLFIDFVLRAFRCHRSTLMP